METNNYSVSDLLENKESKLVNINFSKFNIEVPTYIETVEIATSEDHVTSSDNKTFYAEIESFGENQFVKTDDCNDFTIADPVSGSELQKPIQTIKIRTEHRSGQIKKIALECHEFLNSDKVTEDGASTGVDFEDNDNDMVKSSNNSLKSHEKPLESISVVTNEEIVSHGVTNYQIDYSNISDVVLCEPSITYNYGVLTLKCTKRNKRIFIKKFECSTLGLGDKEAVANVQAFINSKECIRRLAIVEKLDPWNIVDLISEDIKLTRVSNKHVRLVCTYPDGRTITKVFPGSELGIKDPAIRNMIQAFIDSKEGRLWLMKGAESSGGGKGNWTKIGEVFTGVDTKKFINNTIKFDVNQRFTFQKKVLEIIRDEDALPASVSSHATWGSAHRADDRFSLKVPPKNLGKTVVARCLLECASLTGKCKTDCGIPISDVTIINGKFSCCGMVKESQICFNCLIDNTSQWYNMENGTVICNSCYKYFQRRGVHRPYCRKYNRKERIHESHTKCTWKMKLELRGNDISKWIIYEHVNNDKDHNIKVPCQTRPTLAARDKWDKLRSLAKLTPKQILLSEGHLRNKMPDIQGKADFSVFKSIRTRARVIDSRKKNASITMKDGIPISSQWKGSRITVEKYFEHLIFLQKENRGENKEYHLVICPADSIENLSDLEIPIEGNVEKANFKNGIIVVYYDPCEGVAAAFLISCMENGLGLAISHELTFKIVEANDQLSSILHQEKRGEYEYNFKPVLDTSGKCSRVKQTNTRKHVSKSEILFNYDNICHLISEKPRISKVSDVRVRLQCMLPDGRSLTKLFASSNLGAQDPETQKAIQDFIDSPECKQWIERKGEAVWIKVGEVTTGSDTEKYLYHTINFEVMQRFFYRKNLLEIIPNGNAMLSVLSKPGVRTTKSKSHAGIHKIGNTFCLKVSPEEIGGNKVVATMYIDCASISELCKTKCGHLAKDVSVVDGLFSCCGLRREQEYACSNCFTDNSDRWSRIAEDSFLCHTCHNYYKKMNEHRPTRMNKTKRKKIHENHVKCDWKMKMELRAADVTRWHVFKYHMNKEAHANAAGSSLFPRKRGADLSEDEKPSKKIKLFGGKDFDFTTESSTKMILAFPRFAACSGESHQLEHSEKPDENGFLMYPEIKEYITGLVLRDISCPKEIRLFISQFACENFLVVESRDSKCNQNTTIKELRTLVKGFIYYVQSDICTLSRMQDSKKLMICLGKGYPTLYFAQEAWIQAGSTEPGQASFDTQNKNLISGLENTPAKKEDAHTESSASSKNESPVKISTSSCIVRILNAKKEKPTENKKGNNCSEAPLKIFVTTGTF